VKEEVNERSKKEERWKRMVMGGIGSYRWAFFEGFQVLGKNVGSREREQKKRGEGRRNRGDIEKKLLPARKQIKNNEKLGAE